MVNQRHALKRYIRSIRRVLPCCRKMKKSIISQLNQSIKDFLVQHPNADADMLQAHFGTPQQIAATCIDVQNTPAMLKKYSLKKRVQAITVSTMATLILTLSGYIAFDAYLDTGYETKYVVETIFITEGEVEYVEPEESGYHLFESIVYQ